MKNKQLDNKDLLMNKKEELIWRVIDNGNLIIAESKQTIQSEVEATLQHANYVIEHIEDYKNQIIKCEEVLKELNPQFAKDKARDERIAGIENEVAGMKGDIAKILAAVTKN